VVAAPPDVHMNDASPADNDDGPSAPSSAKVPKKYFELDGVLYELRPVKKKPEGRRPRGLAACSPEKRAEISSKGGRATASSPNAVRWSPETAREAGRKGGLAKAARARDLSAAAE
jgi:hypothetical protein